MILQFRRRAASPVCKQGEGAAAPGVNEAGVSPRSAPLPCGSFIALTVLVVTGAASFLGVLWAVGYWEPDPSVGAEDTGGRGLASPAPGEHAWDVLPDDLEVAAAILRDVPPPTALTTTTTTVAPVLAPPVAEVRPSPDPAPNPTVQGGDSIEALICSYGWDCGRALAVARCESRLDPTAVGGAGERGLFQIHPVHRARLGARWDALFDPVVNVAVAHEMWRTQGWRPWSCG